MTTHYVLDTHALVWFLDHDPCLGHAARALLQDESNPLVIPSIVLAKIKHLAAKRRFATKVADVLRVIGSVGTALVLQPFLGQIAIVTCDQAIINTGLVPTVW